MTEEELNQPHDVEEPPLGPTARKILDAAKVVLLRDGPEGLTLRAVHTEAGVRNGAASIYHFGTKAGLLRALYRDMMDDYVRAALEPLAALPPEASLQDRVHVLMESWRRLHQKPQLAMQLFYTAFSSIRRSGGDIVRTFYRDWLDAISRALLPEESRDPRVAERRKAIASIVTAIWDGIELQSMILEDEADFGFDATLEIVEQWLVMVLTWEEQPVDNRYSRSGEKLDLPTSLDPGPMVQSTP